MFIYEAVKCFFILYFIPVVWYKTKQNGCVGNQREEAWGEGADRDGAGGGGVEGGGRKAY